MLAAPRFHLLNPSRADAVWDRVKRCSHSVGNWDLVWRQYQVFSFGKFAAPKNFLACSNILNVFWCGLWLLFWEADVLLVWQCWIIILKIIWKKSTTVSVLFTPLYKQEHTEQWWNIGIRMQWNYCCVIIVFLVNSNLDRWLVKKKNTLCTTLNKGAHKLHRF